MNHIFSKENQRRNRVMSQIINRGCVAIFVLAVLVFTLPVEGAGVPPLFNYQGYLTDANDAPYSNGFYDIEFRIWSADSSGTLVWGEKYNVYILAGRFNVILGQGGTALTNDSPAALVSSLGDCFKSQGSIPGDDGSLRWLGLKVLTSQSGQPVTNAVEISPRQRLLASPYALKADSANYAESAMTASNATRLNNLPATDYLKKSAALKNASGTPVMSYNTGTGEAQPSLLRENAGTLEVTAPATLQRSLNVNETLTAAGNVGVGGSLGVAADMTVGANARVHKGLYMGSTWPDAQISSSTNGGLQALQLVANNIELRPRDGGRTEIKGLVNLFRGDYAFMEQVDGTHKQSATYTASTDGFVFLHLSDCWYQMRVGSVYFAENNPYHQSFHSIPVPRGTSWQVFDQQGAGYVKIYWVPFGH
jgi:hypothetical protein